MTNFATGSINDELLFRIDNSIESRLFHKIVILVSLGMLEASIGVYTGSAVASSLTASKWSTAQENSMLLSANFLGLLIGSLIAGLIGDYKGRKVAYQVNLLLFGGFTVLSAFSPNMDMLIVCRFLAGIGLGSEIVTGFTFINEFAPVARRGRWCGLVRLFAQRRTFSRPVARRGRWCGLVSLVANCGLPTSILLSALVIPNTSWRVVFFVVGILAIVLWFFRKDIPESPRWLISKGRYEEAALIVEQLNSASITNYRNNDKSKGTALLKRDQHHNLFVMHTVGVVAAVATNVCSYAFTTWVPTILVSKGISLSSSLLTSSLMMLGAPFGCLIGLLLLDRIGRKKMIVSAFLMTAILGIAYAKQSTTISAIILGFFLVLFLYVLTASVTAVYVPELFPTRIRFRCVGIVNAAAKSGNVFMPLFVAFLLAKKQEGLIYASISVLAIVAMVIVGFFGPETSHRKLR